MQNQKKHSILNTFNLLQIDFQIHVEAIRLQRKANTITFSAGSHIWRQKLSASA